MNLKCGLTKKADLIFGNSNSLILTKWELQFYISSSHSFYLSFCFSTNNNSSQLEILYHFFQKYFESLFFTSKKQLSLGPILSKP